MFKYTTLNCIYIFCVEYVLMEIPRLLGGYIRTLDELIK